MLLKNFDWWQEQLAKGGTVQQQMSMLQAVISLILNTSLWVTVTLCTKPENIEMLKKFYKQARPMGYWKPVRQAILDEGYELNEPKGLMLGGIWTTLVGFSWITLLILGLSKLYIGAYVFACILIVFAIVLAFVFKRVFNWHMARLETDNVAESTDSLEQTITE